MSKLIQYIKFVSAPISIMNLSTIDCAIKNLMIFRYDDYFKFINIGDILLVPDV